MSELLKVAAKAFLETFLALVADKSLTDQQKADRLERAGLALGSEPAVHAAADKLLGGQ